MLVETTAECRQTARILVLLEELGAGYQLRVHPDGHFWATYGRPGPRFVDGDLELFYCSAILRHCTRALDDGRFQPTAVRELAQLDSTLELSDMIGPAFVAWRQEETETGTLRRPTRIAEAKSRFIGFLRFVEAMLDESDGDWLFGAFGLADCAMAPVTGLTRLFEEERLPRLRAYAERLTRRESFRRVEQRLALARSSASPLSAAP